MPIPDYQSLMLPLLRSASDGNDHTTRETVEVLANEFQLTSAERSELLASGQQAIFNNRVGWANSYLKKAGLLESPRRGALRITARGKQILGDKPARIDVKFLERFPEFIEFRDAGERIGQSGDGGIDGIIKEDRLGLDTIFIQAKRWQGSVGRPEIQKFVGALQGQRAKKGVFITTSSYTAEAIDYASRIDTKVVLIDGQLLANLMMDFDVGVSVSASYIVKRIDSDYFEESEVGL
jgi:restriction endonuclease Mrr